VIRHAPTCAVGDPSTQGFGREAGVLSGTIAGYRAGPKLVRVDLADVDRMLRPIATVDPDSAA
jgi:hypothetical protein